MEETKNKVWDDKFGLIEGVGKDAEIVTNEKGGKQSKAPMAMHLIDPQFLAWFAANKAEELSYFDENENYIVDDEDIENHNPRIPLSHTNQHRDYYE